MAQSQTYLLLIPDKEEYFVESEFSVAESVLAEMERLISKALAKGILLLHERRGLIAPRLSSPESLGLCAVWIWKERCVSWKERSRRDYQRPRNLVPSTEVTVQSV